MSSQPISWERWLQRLANPSWPLAVENFGRTTVDPRWEIRTRCLREHVLYLVLTGEIEVVGPGLHLAPWSMLWLPPRVVHGFRAVSHPLALYHLRFGDVRAPWACPRQEPLLLHRRRELLPVFARLHDEHHARLPLRDHAFRAVLVQLFCLIHRAEGGGPPGGGLDEGRRTRIADLVERHVCHGLTPHDLAAAVDLSLAHFTRLFTRTYGVAPRSWLLHERVRRAAQVLREGDAPIGDIALDHGFADIFVFSRQFRIVMGQSPSAWRHAGRQGDRRRSDRGLNRVTPRQRPSATQ